MKSAARHTTTIRFFGPPSLSGEVSHVRAQFCPHVVYDVLIVRRRVEVKSRDWPKLIGW